MIGRTLGRYYAGLFLKWIVGLFIGATLLAFMVDTLELLRGSFDEGESIATLLAVSALRVPLITEQILPFTVLLGAIAALTALSRRSELVVSRASGLSVWQFVAPGVLVALAVGLFASLVYNPLATEMKLQSDRLVATSSRKTASFLSEASSESWLRQRTPDGDAVMHVGGIADGGRMILEPVFWVFGKDGRLERRIEAVVGELAEDHWTLSEVTIVDTSGTPRRLPAYDLPTRLTPDQVRGRLGSPETVSFWRLPGTIEQAAASGLPPYRFRLQFHALLSRPLLLASMVLIAATVSLGQSRAGGTGRMILGGVSSGFMLYVVTEIARDLGSEGLVPAALAAWAPGVVATLLGSTVLLYREDG